MPKLPKFTLDFDEKKNKWTLENDRTDKTIKTFSTKEQATRGGVLERALGKEGGSVKIQKMSGTFQEERTYPAKADPRQSKG